MPNLTEFQMLDLVKMVDKSLVPQVLGLLLEDDKAEGGVEKEFEQRWKLRKVPEGAKNPSKIRQGLLFEKPGFYLRIREETPEGGESKYTMTCKFFKTNDEAEVDITSEMFGKLWPETEKGKQMIKTRYRIGPWEIDDIESPPEKAGVVAELETDTKGEKVEPPENFDVVSKFEYK